MLICKLLLFDVQTATCWENANIKVKSIHRVHRLLMRSLTMAKDQDVMNCQEKALKKVVVNYLHTVTKALTGTRKVKVEELKQKEEATKREKKLLMMAPPSPRSDLERPAENIHRVSNITILITKTVIEVVVDLLM